MDSKNLPLIFLKLFNRMNEKGSPPSYQNESRNIPFDSKSSKESRLLNRPHLQEVPSKRALCQWTANRLRPQGRWLEPCQQACRCWLVLGPKTYGWLLHVGRRWIGYSRKTSPRATGCRTVVKERSRELNGSLEDEVGVAARG